MFCPQCGLERISEQTNFCSRCGFLLTGVSRLILNGGEISGNASPVQPKNTSARTHGLKQGLFIFLLTFLVVPLVVIISVALQIGPVPTMLSAISLFVGGILRMVYALLFESAQDSVPPLNAQILVPASVANATTGRAALSPQTVPASNFVAPIPGLWRDTNDLQRPNVAESSRQLR